MLFKKEIHQYIWALILISLGGWLLHLRIHPIVEANPANFIPFIFGLLNVIIVPFLLNSKKTVIIGYLINGFGVIFGTVIMATFSLSALPSPLTIGNLLLKTTLADIFILLAKLFIAQRVLAHYYPSGLGRMFTTLWWIKHFIYVAVIFAAGHFLWR